MNTPDLVQELGFRVLDEEDDDPVLLRADGTPVDTWREGYPYGERLPREIYDRDKRLLQIELLKLQYWVKRSKQRLVIVLEGRDAAGKGGTIKRFMEHLNPRGASIVALEKPTDREQTQWYFQRYVAHLPAAGEMVLFDRSWYNRACVERVMGFATKAEVQTFLTYVPLVERTIINSGVILVKYWLEESMENQTKRFTERIDDYRKIWKLS